MMTLSACAGDPPSAVSIDEVDEVDPTDVVDPGPELPAPEPDVADVEPLDAVDVSEGPDDIPEIETAPPVDAPLDGGPQDTGPVTVCAPGDPPVCVNAGAMAHCNEDGSALNESPCPPGTGCLDGACIHVRPNVILLADTSGSMSLLAGQDIYPDECEGEACPQWEFPLCDDPADPATRIGRAREALSTLVSSDTAASVRLALQRFPQVAKPQPECKGGYSAGLVSMTPDNGKHEVDVAWFKPNLGQILAVPFQDGTETNDVGAFLAWLDFTESIAPTATSCFSGLTCASQLCLLGKCQDHDDPELRGTGGTPLGKSLFYAGEYLRLFVRVQGMPCAEDADCRSPHHTCVDSACDDPFRHCRPNVIVAFTDGEETIHKATTNFFHPWVQAKRLRFGLGCSNDSDCLGGAACVDKRCLPPGDLPARICKGVYKTCDTDDDCPGYFCGKPEPCIGECLKTALPFADPSGANHLENAAGEPIAATIHVADATGYGVEGMIMAMMGGGQHLPVDFTDADALAAQLLTLVDVKAGSCASE